MGSYCTDLHAVHMGSSMKIARRGYNQDIGAKIRRLLIDLMWGMAEGSKYEGYDLWFLKEATWCHILRWGIQGEQVGGR